MTRLVAALTLAIPLFCQTAPHGWPVMLDRTVVLRLQAAPEALSPEQRAREIEARLKAVAEDISLTHEDVHTAKTDLYTAILVRNHLILAVFPEDVRATGKTADELAAEYSGQIRSALQDYRSRRAWLVYLKSSLKLGVLWLLFGIAIFGQGALIGWMRRRTQEASAQEKSNVLAWTAAWVFTVVRIFMFIFFLVLFLGLVSYSLAQFPVTEPLAFQVKGLVAEPALGVAHAVIDYLPNLVVLLLVVVLVYLLRRLTKAFFQAIERGDVRISGFHRDWAEPTASLVTVLLVAFGLIVAYPYLPGSHTDAFKGVSLFFGLLISIGSGSSVGNVLAGIQLIYMRPFRVGDWVKISDETGEVIERSLLNTRVRTYKNEEITLGNSLVLGSKIVNYSGLATSQPVIFHTTITIGYDAPWQSVHQALLAAAGGTKFVLADPAPFVLQTSLNDYHISYQINCYTRTPHEMVNIYSELHQRIQDSFNSEGIEIMSPAFFGLRDANTVTIPEAHRPPGYQPPAFRVQKTEGSS